MFNQHIARQHSKHFLWFYSLVFFLFVNLHLYLPPRSSIWLLPFHCSSSSPPPASSSLLPSSSPLPGTSELPLDAPEAAASDRGATGSRSRPTGWNTRTEALKPDSLWVPVCPDLFEVLPTRPLHWSPSLAQTILDTSGMSDSRWLFLPRGGCQWAWRTSGSPAPSCLCWAPQKPKFSFCFHFSPSNCHSCRLCFPSCPRFHGQLQPQVCSKESCTTPPGLGFLWL